MGDALRVGLRRLIPLAATSILYLVTMRMPAKRLPGAISNHL